MTQNKTQIIATLKEEFDQWEKLLNGLSEAQINTPPAPSEFSVKDVMAHLWAWQQRSIARLEAGIQNKEPEFPQWHLGLDLESDGEPHQVNGWIYKTNRDRPWPNVYQDWKTGFLHTIELGEAIPEQDLLDKEKFPWLEGYTLADILTSSYEHHHQDHLTPLLHRFHQQGI